MSAVLTTDYLSNCPDTVVRAAIDEAIRLEGPKRGMWRAAELLGVTVRWVRGFRYGEPARVSADVYVRAMRARQQLRTDRLARLRAEIAALEGEQHDPA